MAGNAGEIQRKRKEHAQVPHHNSYSNKRKKLGKITHESRSRSSKGEKTSLLNHKAQVLTLPDGKSEEIKKGEETRET